MRGACQVLYRPRRDRESKAGWSWTGPGTGRPPTAANGERDRYRADTSRGGHAVCLVGYTRTHFIVRNSWRQRWGDGGFAYASDAYAASAFEDAYGAVL